MAKDKKQPHIRDLFVRGEEAEIRFFAEGEMQHISVYLKKPTPLEQQEAQRKARIVKARTRLRLSDGDDRLALEQELASLEKDGLIDVLMSFHSGELEQRAHNDILYSKEYGSDWTSTGEDMIALSQAHTDRWGEIIDDNELRAKEEVELVDTDKDPELMRIQKKLDKFNKEKTERESDMTEKKVADMNKWKKSTVFDKTMEKYVEVEADLAFYQEYQLCMLYEAVRFPDDHVKHYFQSPDEILEYPQVIRAQLSAAYEAMDMGAEHIKNLGSLLSS